jgi:mono/diheme cytochrome c family protein
MRRGIPHRHKALFLTLGALGLVLLGAIISGVMLLSGAYSTAATKQHFKLTYRVLEAGLHYSVSAAAEEVQVPDLKRMDVRVGHACFQRHCAQCHGAPGISRDAIGMGQLPSPSSLAQSAREWPPEHLFYVTQKGVRMSGMPAWEFRISAEGLWSTVAFLKRMPEFTFADYQSFAASTTGIDCPRPEREVAYSAQRAEILIRQYACHTCHQFDGVVGPITHVGPTLEDWHRRKYIAGVLPNTRENLQRWLLDPRAVSPATLMPDSDMSAEDARHITRFMFGER